MRADVDRVPVQFEVKVARAERIVGGDRDHQHGSGWKAHKKFRRDQRLARGRPSDDDKRKGRHDDEE